MRIVISRASHGSSHSNATRVGTGRISSIMMSPREAVVPNGIPPENTLPAR